MKLPNPEHVRFRDTNKSKIGDIRKMKGIDIIRTASRFTSELKFENIPNDVIEKAKLHILDVIGLAYVGQRLGKYKPIFEIIKNENPSGSRIFGEDCKLAYYEAAFINSCMIHSAANNDTHRLTVTHPGCVVFPAALAFAEKSNVDGKKFISSIILGYEFFIRMAKIITPSVIERGFHVTSLFAPIGAAITAGKMLDLTEEELANAISIALIQSSGLLEAFAEMESISIQIARGCQAGVLSALISQKGVKGCQTILEGGRYKSKGFFQAYSDDYNTTGVFGGLGRKYEILNTAIKLHGGCRYLHTSIDGVLDIISENNIYPGEINKINLKTTSLSEDKIKFPKNPEEAIFSKPFAISCAVLEGNVDIFQFIDEKLKDPKILAFMKKIHVEVDHNLDKDYRRTKNPFAVIVEIKTNNGKIYKKRQDYAKGEPELPCDQQDVLQKFKRCASKVVGVECSEEIISVVKKIDKLENLSKFVNLIFDFKKI
jgi:2-methylcitrate dehydratase PrpD